MRKSVLSLILLASFAPSNAASPLPAAAPRTPVIVPMVVPPPQPFAKALPPLDSVALPEERPILNDFLRAASRSPRGSKAALAATNEALERLPAPTRLRGVIQLMRAGLLSGNDRPLDAIDAVEESVRLLPGYSGPLLTAVSIYAYANRPREAADYLLRAIAADPETVRTFDDYEVNNLLRRLEAAKDQARVRGISDRLLAIGWLGTNLESRSRLAAAGIKRRIADGDVAGARQLVSKLLVPAHSRSLLMMNAYRPIWPDIATWAGPTLEKQWPTYLREAHDRWSAGQGDQATLDYLTALMAARHYRTAVRDILPRFDHVDRDRYDDLIFAVSPMARTLAILGRADEGDALFNRMQAVWPLGAHANALNVTINHANFLLEQGRPEAALTKMDAAIADSRRWGPEINNDAVAGMQHGRACMLHALGRDAEVGASVALASAVEQPGSLAALHLCLDDRAAAKRALIAGLRSEATRESAVGFVQLTDPAEPPTAYGKKMRAGIEALRRDPDVLRAVAQYGRVLPWPATASVPREGAASGT